jgi:hypothetical protein
MTDSKKNKCPTCRGKGEIFSGFVGHPETSDGKCIYYDCTDCKRTGFIDDKKYLDIIARND